MWKYLNKGISTPIAISIILILVIAVGGFTWWQYSNMPEDNLEVELPEKEEVGDEGEEEPEESIETVIPEADKFCQERKEKGFFDSLGFIEEALAAGDPRSEVITGPSFYFNYDEDPEKEIVGTCQWDLWGGYMAFFILDKQDDKYEPVMIRDRGDNPGQRNYSFANLSIKDLNDDGIDEIIYEEAGWYGGGGNELIYVYSPKHDDFFWRKDPWIHGEDNDREYGKPVFSENIEESIEINNFLKEEETSGWNAYINGEYGFEFMYPDDFFQRMPEVVSYDCPDVNFPEECPHRINTTLGELPPNFNKKSKFSLSNLYEYFFGVAQAKIIPEVEKLVINDIVFCHRSESGAAAGSQYVSYYYATVRRRDCIVIGLFLQYPNCLNYSEGEMRNSCQQENDAKPGILEQVISTFRFTK